MTRAASPSMLHKSPIRSLRILSGGPYEDRKGSVFPLHKHEYWELVYYRHGSIVSQIDGKQYHAHPGIVLLTPPGEAHSDYGETNYKNYYFALDIDADPNSVSRILIDDAQHSLRDFCQHLVHELASQQIQREDMLNVYAQQLRILIERAQQHHHKNDDAVLQVFQIQAYMSEHLSESIRISDIAEKHHCATSTMRDWFYKVCQCSPQQYLSKIRFEHARQLIIHSDLKLAAVAQVCGFDSLSHLSRVVKQHCGLSPGALRKG